MNKTDLATRRQLRAAVIAAAEKKALDPILLDIRKLSGFCDYFFLCHGSNTRQVQAIAEAIEDRLQTGFELRPVRRDGVAVGEWVALDYVDFMVHVFTPQKRKFYSLERLWTTAARLSLPPALRTPAPDVKDANVKE